ncbi:hypothetical protein F52700_11096 [Fusarium sp. NRRL 52700]|nr:hypothetical protein F52700_11096 [Fusarium sp. NRRL 52700]
MEPSEISHTNEDLLAFTFFERLPPELREMIWECLISVQRHLRIEGRLERTATIGSFSISEGLYLSQVCSESRKVLSRIIAREVAEDGNDTSTHRNFGTVLLTMLDEPSLEILSSLTTDIDYIAVPPPSNEEEVQELHLALQKRVAAGSRQIKVIYTGRPSEFDDQYRPPGNHPMTPPADFKILTGNDAVSYLGLDKNSLTRWDRLPEEETEPGIISYAWWSNDLAAEEMRSDREELTSEDGIAMPVIKQCFILTRPARGIDSN